MALTVTVLGCSGSYAAAGQACSGYLVRGGGTTIWLDAGSGTLANLQRHVSPADVDAVVLSHEHPDHWSDIEGYWVACRYSLGVERAPVYAPAGLRSHVYHDKPPLQWAVVADGDAIDIGGLHLTFSRTDHPPETLAVRIDGEDRSFAYSADTGSAWALASLGSGIDLALCEATWLRVHEDVAQHLSARQAGLTALEAGVGRLVLTHLEPGTDPDESRAEGSEAFGRAVDVATTHEEYVI